MSVNVKFGLFLFTLSVTICIAQKLPMLQYSRNPLLRKRKSLEIYLIDNGSSFLRSREVWRAFKSKNGPNLNVKCELEIRNVCGEVVLLCWIDENGKLYHFRPINDDSIKDGSVSNIHVEFTCTHHAFIIIKRSVNLPKYMTEIPAEDMICCLRLLKGESRHIVTLHREKKLFGWYKIIISHTVEEMDDPGAVIDTSNKFYKKTSICGFQILYEPDVFDCLPTLQSCLQEDLDQVNRLLPPSASNKLHQSTQFWINKSLTFGTTKRPVIGMSCTFHPKDGHKWLEQNGMNVAKCGGIEIYCAENYLTSRSYWGIGGLLLHELCHAYHNHHTSKGFDNESVLHAYNVAMEKKLYDKVAVHGKQGENGPTKAYACANCMEFFAELSVAYHWHIDGTEYNKWYPHNRDQLRSHDIETFIVLKDLWEDSSFDSINDSTGC